jgi:hypothetical protein
MVFHGPGKPRIGCFGPPRGSLRFDCNGSSTGTPQYLLILIVTLDARSERKSYAACKSTQMSKLYPLLWRVMLGAWQLMIVFVRRRHG